MFYKCKNNSLSMQIDFFTYQFPNYNNFNFVPRWRGIRGWNTPFFISSILFKTRFLHPPYPPSKGENSHPPLRGMKGVELTSINFYLKMVTVPDIRPNPFLR